MSGSLRVLDQDDLPELRALLRRDPVSNLFVASRVATSGLAPEFLGCPIYGYFDAGELVAACHVGANLVPIGEHPDALSAFARAIGPRRQVSSIMGPAGAVLQLHRELCGRWGSSWIASRDIRAHQPLMMIDSDPATASDPRVRRVTAADYEPYLVAAIAMYTEEVGVSPLDSSNSYQRYVRMLIQLGRAFGAVHDDHVWFKADVGSAWGTYCQVQGVWLAPGLRGKKMSAPAMAQVVRLCRERFGVVSLYVNDYNTRARRLYESIGFQTVGELATVLY